eukprot:UN04392
MFSQPTCGLLPSVCVGIITWAESTGQFSNPDYVMSYPTHLQYGCVEYPDFSRYSKGAILGEATLEDFHMHYKCRKVTSSRHSGC